MATIFNIQLRATGAIAVQIGSTAKKTTTLLTTGTWAQITVSFILQTVLKNLNLLAIYINGVNDIMAYDLTVGTLTFTPSTDIVRVGGPTSFLGSLKELSIYSPGSLSVSSRNLFFNEFSISFFT